MFSAHKNPVVELEQLEPHDTPTILPRYTHTHPHTEYDHDTHTHTHTVHGHSTPAHTSTSNIGEREGKREWMDETIYLERERGRERREVGVETNRNHMS